MHDLVNQKTNAKENNAENATRGMTQEGGKVVTHGTDPYTLRRAMQNPRGSSPETILELQRIYGNKAVTQAIQRSYVASTNTVQRGIFSSLFGQKKAKTQPPDFFTLLEDQSFNKLFFKFCASEYSTEDITVYNLLQQYKANPLQKKRLDAIFNRFFKRISGGTSVINLGNKDLAEIQDAMDKDEYEKAAKLAESKVRINLVDTFTRFKFTPEYREWCIDNGYEPPLKKKPSAQTSIDLGI